MVSMLDENKRRFLKLLGGGIIGFSIPMSIYEGAIIPELQRRFIKELEYWMNEYKLADEKLKELQSKYETSNNTLTNLKQFENELNNQIKLYNQKKDEAINKIKETINKYEILLGGEVSFEKSAVKILEDLKIKGDKLLKVYKHLPAIVDLYWKPTKVINDKIYDINVSFEVISPLNSLKEVEVMLIPVEYRYFITKYGMREEDYHKVL
jgi:chromosome segregation ATPase